jgi:cytidylate kinase
MPNVFHVRLVASLPKRIERIQKTHELSPGVAAAFIEREDRGSRRYLKAYFHTRADDDLMYHMVINTDRVPYLDTARLIADGARRHFMNGVIDKN